MSGQFTLGKQERLKKRKQIEEVFAKGRKLSIAELKLFYIITKKELNASLSTFPPKLQAGVGVGTKNFKKAVHRNRIKRLLRECWRLNNTLLKKAVTDSNKSLSVFIIYTGKELPDYKIMESMVIAAVGKLHQALDR